MSLENGTKLGAYEVLEPIGVGGMGEVYRAIDTRLDRVVAIKVLPEHLADNAERRERLEREAKALSQLNHPHICTLYDIGHQDGIDYLVMEYIEGETLAERLERGGLSREEALRYAIQIAEGLDRAHRAGIVHRDLKPANVMLTKPGVKLLDFGLAKLVTKDSGADHSETPTVQKNLTHERAVVGTPRYMAPEQLEGGSIDARTDIYAFGLVLREMLAGVDLERSPLLERALERCLVIDPDERWQSAKDLAYELGWILERAGETTAGTSSPRKTWLPWSVVAIVSVLVVGVLALRTTPEGTVHKFHVLPPEGQKLQAEVAGPMVSPDGRRFALVASDESGTSRLWVRGIEDTEFRFVPGTEDAQFPFWSPDSGSLGFFAGDEVKKVRLDGTPPETVCSNPAGYGRGGTWNRDGVILFSDHRTIYRVSDNGGTTSVVMSIGEEVGNGLTWPSFLPDGHHFLYLEGRMEQNDVRYSVNVASLDSEQPRRLVNAFSNAAFASPGVLLYARDGILLAHPFDADELELSGEATPITEGLRAATLGHTGFWVSENGVLSLDFASSISTYRPTWFDRSGTKLGIVDVPDAAAGCFDIALSPDATLVAMTCNDSNIGTSDIHVHDLSRGISTRATHEPEWDQFATWSPAGHSLLYYWNSRELREQSLDGRGARRVVARFDDISLKPLTWSPDGKLVLYQTHERGINSDLMLAPTNVSGDPLPFLNERFSEIDGQFSPDGRWVAYASDESGRFEIYVASFPDGETRYRISRDGGRRPHWRGDGRELFYIAADDRLVAMPIQMAPTFELGEPEMLFETEFPLIYESRYSVTSDGQRFLLYSRTKRPEMTVMLNWTAALEK